jgi:prephenate dehydratase
VTFDSPAPDRPASGDAASDRAASDRAASERAVPDRATPDGGATAPVPVAYAGEPGAFAEDAVLAAFGEQERSALPAFRDVFEAVAAGRARAGIVPIENLVNGTVRENYDLLLEHDLVIVGEVVVPVRLCLAALPGQGLDDIERVYSHIQALGQAERFLRTRSWTLLTTYNTAGAGKLIADRGERGAAAVLSPRAAHAYGLRILADEIQSVPDNRTRFLILERPAVGEDGGPREGGTVRDGGAARTGRRTTLVFAVRNEPGTLLAVLRVFATRTINLSALESRPSRERAWEYVFWADLDGDVAEPRMAAALADLATITTMVRVLGSYPRAAED